MRISTSIEDFRSLAEENDIHTVEVGAPDTQGHLRGKRIPVGRFLKTAYKSPANIADAMFVFDMQCDLPENEFVNPDTGYLDAHLIPDMSTGRVLSHRPGYAIVLANAKNEHGQPHPLAPRTVLARQVERCRAAGLDPLVATEMEFYLCTPDWQSVQQHIQYSSLTDAIELEPVLYQMRKALLDAGIEVEASNAEYGPGQFEINAGPTDAMTAADNAVIFKSIVKQVAVLNGLRATFMPKPWADQSGSGMHIHSSLIVDGANAFADCEDGEPNDLMRAWLAGLLEHAAPLAFLGASTSNGPKRIRRDTFAPTHVTWGLDNRSVLARCITERGSSANRVEFRASGADANPYLLIAGLVAAGTDGVERGLDPGPHSVGDAYSHPGEHAELPADLSSSIKAYADSPLAEQLGDVFSRSLASIALADLALAAFHNPHEDDVNDWERARFIEHS
jgi:glutamine synthetase